MGDVPYWCSKRSAVRATTWEMCHTGVVSGQSNNMGDVPYWCSKRSEQQHGRCAILV